MALAEVRYSAASLAVTLKYQAARQGDSMNPHFLVQRGMRRVAIVAFPKYDERIILPAFALAAYGFDADELVTIAEAYGTIEINPMTGDPWRGGEIENLIQNHPEVAERHMRTVVLITCANRAGDVLGAELPFTDHGNGRITWHSTSVFEADGGHWAEYMVRAMTQPSGSVVVPGISDVGSRTRRDLLTAAALTSKIGCEVTLTATDEPERTTILRHVGKPIQ